MSKSHLLIRDIEFEQFGLFGVAFVSICRTGAYLSRAILKKNNRTVQIDFKNRVLVHSDHVFWRLQLLRIDNQTGIAVYNHNRTTTPDNGHTLQTFRVTNTGSLHF
jgi:CRISPR/Cas system CMR-associated protein Cmr3 (group 5 of RAMP superfamily)